MGPRARTLTNHGSDASAEHRRKLEALFSGGGSGSLSQTPTVAPLDNQRVFASPRRQVGRKPSEYSMRLERLRIAREPNDVREAADVFLKNHQLPDDMDILLKVLQHPSEKVLCNVMGQISFLLNKRRARATIILVDRLREIGSRAICKDTQDCLDGLHQQIKALESA
jgi:hypothetical protein